jgi:hypothetical protein
MSDRADGGRFHVIESMLSANLGRSIFHPIERRRLFEISRLSGAVRGRLLFVPPDAPLSYPDLSFD